MPEFSVIVPVYKVEKYLDRCIGSILAQTFSDFELILIDDGSPDNSGQICDEYAGKDNRIHVIHKENGGVSTARNAGLDIAQGKFIVFVDSDDEVAPNYLELLSSKKADVVISGITNLDPNNNVQHYLEFTGQDLNEIDLDCIRRLRDSRAIFCVYSKKYKKEIIENAGLRFNNAVSLGEDTLFFVHYLLRCNSLSFVSGTPYLYHKYTHETLSALGPSYVDKSIFVNELILEVLQSRFRESVIDIIDKNIWDTFYTVIFSTVRNQKMSFIQKLESIRYLTSKPEFTRLAKDVDNLMPKDAKKVRMVTKTGRPVIILCALTLFDWIGKHKHFE